jgi:hypothetical protein
MRLLNAQILQLGSTFWAGPVDIAYWGESSTQSSGCLRRSDSPWPARAARAVTIGASLMSDTCYDGELGMARRLRILPYPR